ncbi:hypothetical protein SmJEL517_g02262 [Synchytrium microbalum]|uniref:Peptidylprolyl isomerase n=1 Tax=Synchytrium microbalum TaxID=1806994 RepID=A0A507CBL8_9FUNG|nr:uncharacterized protein SmJEL517_g02262 [Synchytrium microbalum]TPX35344.1 hypothetical protein SmJEL517_g02262 [Synchytrium microbalum]
MGRQRKRDKLYVTSAEWAESGGAKEKRVNGEFKKLPFSCCSLTLTPFEHPVCTADGTIFDLVNIIPWIKKNGTNPVTGEKLETKDLKALNFTKSSDSGEYHCPITFKVFNEHTHIVAIRTSGNVYSYEAVDSLNLKTKNFKDLLTDEPFTRKDIITIQDPHNIATNRNINEFHYIKNDLKPLAKEGGASNDDEDDDEDTQQSNSKINVEGKGSLSRVLAQVSKASSSGSSSGTKSTTPVTLTPSYVSKPKKAYNEAHYSTNAASSSLTSTALTPQFKNVPAVIDKEYYMFGKIKKNAFAVIQTNMGDINIELFASEVAMTSYNFIMLAKSGYYKNVVFHRSIKNFMLQGGDPTGTGKGGSSWWKKDFPDECKSATLSHSGRGVLSMANRGKDTNSSQFFITYKSCTHLDNKHTVFGKVVGGLETLSKIERVPTDDKDKPMETIKMKDVVILVDPFAEFQAELDQQAQAEEHKAAAQKARSMPRQIPAAPSPVPSSGGGIGKYLPSASTATTSSETTSLKRPSIWDGDVAEGSAEKKPKNKSSGFGNFDSW